MKISVAVAFLILGLSSALSAAESGVGPLVQALWWVHANGKPEFTNPQADEKTKGALFKSLAKDGTLKNIRTFARQELSMDTITLEQLKASVESSVPDSRKFLLPKIQAHADFLTTSFDRIDAVHGEAGKALSEWIVTHYKKDQPLSVTVICTGNSRRSILGSTMGNIAAAYYGFPEIKFYSGGTAPTAFNPRTVRTLSEIGVQIEATGKEAARGDARTENPIYHVRWGKDGSNFETVEFSKKYDDDSNPKSGFAALMVCGEADAGCPFVKGAGTRISMPYLDPKIFDDGIYEINKYSERRDDMGRLMLAVMLQVRSAIGPAKN